MSFLPIFVRGLVPEIENKTVSAAADSSHSAGQGLIGLGPNSGSIVHSIINDHSGDAVVDRIFRQNTSTPNYISFLLGRSGDPTEPFPGDITIGQPLEPYGNITSQPKLTVTQAEGGASGQHWQTLLDKNGIIGPDGQPISVESGVKGAPKDQLTVIFDSGFSLPQVPKYVLRSLHIYIYHPKKKTHADLISLQLSIRQVRSRRNLRPHSWRTVPEPDESRCGLDAAVHGGGEHHVQVLEYLVPDPPARYELWRAEFGG